MGGGMARKQSRHVAPTMQDYLNEGLCGCINAAIVIPVMFSFANIIFRDPIFSKFLPQLNKLVMFSGVVHQLSFIAFSTFPFAVGQVQDAGLVFLSAISSDIVVRMTAGTHHPLDSDIVATTVVVLAICTAALGLCVYIVGRCNLASVVQYLPMPVLAGYLAYIGFFCGISAFGIMANKDVATIYDVPKIISTKSAILIAPGVVGGFMIYCSLRFVRSSLILPLCMAVILSAFFGIMCLSGWSLQDARDYGWIHPWSDPGSVLEAVELYELAAVDWSVMLGQIVKFLAMVVVVTVSSSLDVAAIEMELGRPVDYNQELKTVGLSNLFSGLCGGYTGSYIFSQTIFCLRRGVKTKCCGLTLMLCELLIVIFPISITAYVPKIFFGSLLMLISLDLQYEWLIASRHKMMTSEYVVSVLTFLCIQLWGIEAGMFIGILAASLSFIGLYSQLEVVSVSAQRTSNAQRTFEERLMLMSRHRKVVTLTFRGYIFFGSAASLLPVLKGYMEDVVIPEPESLIDMDKVHNQDDRPIYYSSSPGAAAMQVATVPTDDKDVLSTPGRKQREATEQTGLLGSTESPPRDYSSDGGFLSSSSPEKVLKDIEVIRKIRSQSFVSDVEEGFMGTSKANKTEFLVFDFTEAYGVDSTACRSCFALIASIMRGYTEVTLVFTGMLPSIETLFRSHGVIGDGDVVVHTLNEGLELCEESLLSRYMTYNKRHILHPITSGKTSLDSLSDQETNRRSINQSYTERAALERHQSNTFFNDGEEEPNKSVEMVREHEYQRLVDIIEDYLEVHSSLMDKASVNRYLSVDILAKYFRILQVEMGDMIFDINDKADSVYFVDSGLIQLLRYPSQVSTPCWRRPRTACQLHYELDAAKKQGAFHMCKVTTGGIFGDNCFVLNQPHNMRAVSLTRSFVFVITRARYHDMEKSHPKLLFMLQQVLLKSTAMNGEMTVQQLYPAPWRAIY